MSYQQEQAMPLTVAIPEDLHEAIQSYLAAHPS